MPKIGIFIFYTLPFLAMIFFCNSAMSRELIVVSTDGPPHMIAASNSGIDIDVIKSIVTSMEHSVSFQFTPLKRTKELVKNYKADIFLPTFFQHDTDDTFYSDPFIQYRPMLLSLKDSKLSIEQFSDLKDLRVISFQGATGYFGEEFKKATLNSHYTEMHDMSKIPVMLLKKRCDVVVLDYYIFYYFLKTYIEKSTTNNKAAYSSVTHYASLIESHDIIPQVNAYAGFNSKLLRDQFNKALEKFILNKKHKKVIEKYIGTINSNIIK